jgi:hypothetical protein
MTNHVLYEDGDEDIPEVLQDGYGQVVLSQCRFCKAAEIELTLYLTCEDFANKDHDDETEN